MKCDSLILPEIESYKFPLGTIQLFSKKVLLIHSWSFSLGGKFCETDTIRNAELS